MEDCTPGATERVDYEAMLDPRMQYVHHARPMAVDNVTADDEACVQPPLGPSVQRMTIPEKDAQIIAETERTSPDADDVGCGDGGGGKSSNIVTCMRRKPRCQKPAAVHATPFTNPTHIRGALKR